MKKVMEQQFLTGERALFGAKNMEINYSTFADGESPLKESSNIDLLNSMFKWKYPLWYSKHITLKDCTLFDMARAGIWYTDDIAMTDCIIQAPKTFRRANGIKLTNVTMPNAEETLWNCNDIQMKNVTAKGDYFAMNVSDVKIDGFELVGNYCFDGGKNIEIRNAKLLAKDAFWNCENVTVYDSFISGEYLGWNAKNVTFINCTIESLQGMCYMNKIVLKDCRLLNTTLAFEYSTVDAEINGMVDSVCNPSGGTITADAIGELILDETKINPAKTRITTGAMENAI
ncbi:MAG: DUF3737 family protein [bacterium]|nr:DUF3737 family protein [bacterium]